ncbi:4076_t:CDS:2, partial [Dentiscutata erythropus]
VSKGAKSVIPECIMSIEPKDNKFFDLFDTITLGQYDDKEVKVFIRRVTSEGWREVDNGLNRDLKILEILGFMQVKFCLITVTNLDTPGSTQNKLDAFSIIMRNSREPLLPQRSTENNNHNQLYNEIIELFKAYNVGWTNGLHESIEKTFIIRLASALCQPWASNNRWSQVIPAILYLIEVLKKYSDYLITTNASMNELHHSNESARSPENNNTMYHANACEPCELKDEYI